MDNFDLRKYLAEGKLLKESRYDEDDPNSPMSQLMDDTENSQMLDRIVDKYEEDVVSMWLSSGEVGERSGEDFYKVYDISNPDSLVSKLNDDEESVNALNRMGEKYGEDVILAYVSGESDEDEEDY